MLIHVTGLGQCLDCIAIMIYSGDQSFVVQVASSFPLAFKFVHGFFCPTEILGFDV